MEKYKLIDFLSKYGIKYDNLINEKIRLRLVEPFETSWKEFFQELFGTNECVFELFKDYTDIYSDSVWCYCKDMAMSVKPEKLFELYNLKNNYITIYPEFYGDYNINLKIYVGIDTYVFSFDKFHAHQLIKALKKDADWSLETIEKELEKEIENL